MKVEHTKTHRIINSRNNFPNGQTIDYGTQVLVTDAELVLIECNSKEGLLYIPNWKHEESKLCLLTSDVSLADAVYKAFKPILISRTEKIEVGDWYLDLEDKESINPIYQRNQIEDSVYKQCAKILALPEHFSPQQLQDIVDGKLKGKLLVECETNHNNPHHLKPKHEVKRWKQIKLNPHVTIYSVEEKVYTRIEVRAILHQFNNPQSNEDVFKLNTWFEQNVK